MATLSYPMVSEARLQRAFVVFFTLALIAAAVHYTFKVAEDRSAIVRWRPLLERLVRGEDVYRVGSYPNPPLLGIVLYPITLFPSVSGAILWFLLKVVMAAYAVRWSLEMASTAGCRATTMQTAIVVLLSARPLLGDLEHGNVNILILFLAMVGLRAFRNGKDWLAGLAIALATTFKVTPALFIPYFLYKRNFRVVGWSLIGLALFLFVLPSFLLGPVRNLELLIGWIKLMIVPYVVDGVVEATQVNQSLPGLFYRLFTASPGLELPNDQYLFVNWYSMDLAAARILLKGLILALLLVLLWACRTPSTDRTDWRLACEFGLVFLAMLFISERSWKHHYVTLVLPFAALVTHIAQRSPALPLRRYLTGTLVASFLLMATTSSEIGGLFADGMGHKYAQVYGMFFFAGFVLWVALIALLHCSRAQAAASRTVGSACRSA